jgi:hypothetical protein
MKLKYNFVINEVAGSTVAVAVGEDAAKFKGFIKMNSTGAEIFRMLKNDVSKESLVENLSEIYPEEEIELLVKSVESFVAELIEAEVLE